MLAAPDELQPLQVLMEVHAETYHTWEQRLPGISWQDRIKTPGEARTSESHCRTPAFAC